MLGSMANGPNGPRTRQTVVLKGRSVARSEREVEIDTVVQASQFETNIWQELLLAGFTCLQHSKKISSEIELEASLATH
jgi:hypothetical protein